ETSTMDPDQQLRNERCVDNCAGKLIRSNHRLMGTYVQLMPRMMQRRMDEIESKARTIAIDHPFVFPSFSPHSPL
uniref:Translocase of inner mitochondrial membrane 10 homolog B (yeast) n=1 Tax=Hippocampus comes TaxID=109280 RepID=A0A3Q2XDZ2_HIPCM